MSSAILQQYGPTAADPRAQLPHTELLQRVLLPVAHLSRHCCTHVGLRPTAHAPWQQAWAGARRVAVALALRALAPGAESLRVHLQQNADNLAAATWADFAQLCAQCATLPAPSPQQGGDATAVQLEQQQLVTATAAARCLALMTADSGVTHSTAAASTTAHDQQALQRLALTSTLQAAVGAASEHSAAALPHEGNPAPADAEGTPALPLARQYPCAAADDQQQAPAGVGKLLRSLLQALRNVCCLAAGPARARAQEQCTLLLAAPSFRAAYLAWHAHFATDRNLLSELLQQVADSDALAPRQRLHALAAATALVAGPSAAPAAGGSASGGAGRRARLRHAARLQLQGAAPRPAPLQRDRKSVV